MKMNPNEIKLLIDRTEFELQRGAITNIVVLNNFYEQIKKILNYNDKYRNIKTN